MQGQLVFLMIEMLIVGDKDNLAFAVYYILFDQVLPGAAFRVISADQGVCWLGSTCWFVITRYIKAIGDLPGGHTHFS